MPLTGLVHDERAANGQPVINSEARLGSSAGRALR
jgi:hypothetical protein